MSLTKLDVPTWTSIADSFLQENLNGGDGISAILTYGGEAFDSYVLRALDQWVGLTVCIDGVDARIVRLDRDTPDFPVVEYVDPEVLVDTRWYNGRPQAVNTEGLPIQRVKLDHTSHIHLY